MARLLPFLGVLAALTTIITGWLNYAHRKAVAEARLHNLTQPEGKLMKTVRVFLTSLTALFVGSLLVLGMVITIKTLWELFA